jgi:hypothetical protein
VCEALSVAAIQRILCYPSKEKSARESMNADIIVPESEETEGTETDDEAEENDENDGSDMANEMKSNLEDEMDLESMLSYQNLTPNYSLHSFL